jgi:hypothetical protein
MAEKNAHGDALRRDDRARRCAWIAIRASCQGVRPKTASGYAHAAR